MITMYAVANIDSALWGTRSVGDVKCTSTSTITDSDTDSDTGSGDNCEEAEATRPHWGNGGGDDGVMMRDFAFSRGAALAETTAIGADEEEAVPPRKRLDSDALGISGVSGYGREAGAESVTETRRDRKDEVGSIKRGRISLKASKFIILVPWVLVNVGVTVAYLRCRLYTLALIVFFSQIAGMAVFVVAAWVEMRLQRRSTLPPSSPPPLC